MILIIYQDSINIILMADAVYVNKITENIKDSITLNGCIFLFLVLFIVFFSLKICHNLQHVIMAISFEITAACQCKSGVTVIYKLYFTECFQRQHLVREYT